MNSEVVPLYFKMVPSWEQKVLFYNVTNILYSSALPSFYISNLVPSLVQNGTQLKKKWS
jgi:hypothetical protein